MILTLSTMVCAINVKYWMLGATDEHQFCEKINEDKLKYPRFAS